MVMALIPLIAYAIEFFVACYFLTGLFSLKKKFVPMVITGALIYLFCWVIFIIFDNAIVNTTLFTAANFTIAFLFFDTDLKSSILSSLFLTAAEMSTEFIVMSILSLSTDKDINVYRASGFMFLLMMLLSKTAYLIFSKIALVADIYLKGQKNSHFPLFLLIYPLCSMIILYTFWSIAEKYSLSSSLEIAILIASLAIVLSIITTYIFYSRTSKKLDELYKAQSEAERFETDTAYYSLLDRQNEALKTITHDEKNHLSVIKALADKPEVSTYIDEIYGEINFSSLFGNTQNRYLDLLLNKYQSVCDKNGVVFDTSVKTANLSFMMPSETISLVSNILDNAVEAAKQSEEKRIRLSINRANNFDMFTCVNSCDKQPNTTGQTLITTKSEKGIHGFGVKSIKRIAEKYNGEFNWKYTEQNREFEVDIAFFQN